MIALWLALAGPAWATDLVTEDDRFDSGQAGAVAATPWWQTVEDPTLPALIDEGIAANTDLSGAVARVQQAEGMFHQTRSVLAPTLSFDVSTVHQPINPGSFVPPSVGNANTQNTLQAGLRGAWEIDLFGRNLLGARASRFDKLASEGDRDATAVAIATRVAESYYDLAAARMRLDVLGRQHEANLELLELVELRRDGGAASTVDVLQQRQQVAALEALLPSADAAVELTAYRLSVLLGRPGVTNPIETHGLPQWRDPPASGLPVELLDNRPDLLAAERRSTSARVRQTAATLGFFPTVQVGGQVGWFSIWWGSQTPALTEAYQLTTLVSVPVFAGGRRHGSLRTAKGVEYAAREGYRGAVLVALQEVEGALLQDEAAQTQLTASVTSEELARAAYERSREQWLEGLATYLTVFTNLGAWQRAELDLVDARRHAVSARIQLHDAIGGPWTSGLGSREAR